MISRLTADHVRIRALAADLAGFLHGETAPVDPQFAGCRWELIRQLSVHMACERQALASRRAPDTIVARVEDSLDDVLLAHMRDWTGVTIHQRWSTYCAVTRDLLDRLERRMVYEETALFPSFH